MLCAMCDRVENCVPLHMLQVVHFARALLPSSDSIADSMLDWVVSGARVLRCVVSYCVMFTTCMWWSRHCRIRVSSCACWCVVIHTKPL